MSTTTVKIEFVTDLALAMMVDWPRLLGLIDGDGRPTMGVLSIDVDIQPTDETRGSSA